MQTKLIEFKNHDKETLRGILTVPDKKPRAGTIFLQGFEIGNNGKNRAVSVNSPGVGVAGTIFLQGFERNATVEKKAKRMADALADKNIASLRFDASGCGLSDGDFSKTTLKGRAREMLKALDVFQKEMGGIKINFVAHSLGMCPLALEMGKLENKINKMVFIAPALNQKDLMRFYFVRDLMKIKDPGIKICWANFRQYLDEDGFLADCRRTGRMARENYIGPDYYMEARDLDFSHSFDRVKERVLHVHGECDASVPLESLGVEFPNRIIVAGGDHDLERPDLWEQWFDRAVNFVSGK